MRTMLKAAGVLYVALLSSCVTAPHPSTEPGEFTELANGQVPAAAVPAFADCVLDGFDKAHFVLTNTRARQQRRSTGFRVETLTGSSVAVSAEILDTGHTTLRESRAAALINTTGEREAFSACLQRHQVR